MARVHQELVAFREVFPMGSISPSSLNLTNRQATPAADLAQQAKQAQAQAAAQQAQQANLHQTYHGDHMVLYCPWDSNHRLNNGC